jgi:hypothetical protein
MPLNAAIAVGMVGLGLSLNLLGKWSAHRIGDFLSDSDIYSRRATYHYSWSGDRCFRQYYSEMGSFPPFEVRVLPEWMDVHRKMVYNTTQYKSIDKNGNHRPNIYAFQNKLIRQAYRRYDAIQYHKAAAAARGENFDEIVEDSSETEEEGVQIDAAIQQFLEFDA